MNIGAFRVLGALALLGTTAALTSPAAAQSSLTNKLHANAVESFRTGRFPEAYGRFIALAEAGHPASARYALLMCQHGLELFGKDWDCSPQEVEDWARLAGMPAPYIGPRYYAKTDAKTDTTTSVRTAARR